MHCSRCHSSMSEIKQETDGNCQQTWYQCPTCGQEKTVSCHTPTPNQARFGSADGERVTRYWAGRG